MGLSAPPLKFLKALPVTLYGPTSGPYLREVSAKVLADDQVLPANTSPLGSMITGFS